MRIDASRAPACRSKGASLKPCTRAPYLALHLRLQGWLAEEAGVGEGLAAVVAGADPPPVGPLTARQYELAGAVSHGRF